MEGASAPRHPRQRDFRKKVEAAGTPDWSAAEGGMPLIGAVSEATGVRKYLHKKGPINSVDRTFFVEMGGLEPPSKHRTKQLSTRLVFLWFSTYGCRETG